MSTPIIGLDTETFYSKKLKYGIKELGMARYVDHASFDPYMVSVSDGADSWAGSPKDFNWAALNGAVLVSHNQHFDALVTGEMVKRGLAPAFTPSAWHCSANMSAYLCNQRSLADAAQSLLGVTLSKETRDYAEGKTASDIKADGRWDEMLAYARSDAFNCRELFVRHGHRWPQMERDLSELTIRQGTRGVQIDIDKLNLYIVKTSAALRIAEEQLPWIASGMKPTSTKAIAELCRKEGIPMPPVKSNDGEEAFIAWENAYCKRFPWIEHVANWRSINKFLGTLNTVKTRLDENGCLGFSLKYFGAHTGRWSGDAGLNLQNLRKDPLMFDDRGWLISDLPRLKTIMLSPTLPDFVAFSMDLRSLFIARPGKQLIISDLSQIEPRVLAWMVGDTEMLALMASGQSPYEAHARATMGFTGGNLKKEDKGGYALAKARVLGLGFGCGWEKFIAVAQAMAGIDITADDPEFIQATRPDGTVCVDRDGEPKMISGYGHTSRTTVNAYRASNPKVVGMWKSLDTAFRDSVGGDFEMQLPSGRMMVYKDVRMERRTIRNEDGTLTKKTVFTAEVGHRRTVFYGGMLTENAVQATARDIFGSQLVALDRTSGIDVLFSVHDEAVNEADIDSGISERDVEVVMGQCPEWISGCPISAEAILSPCYRK